MSSTKRSATISGRSYAVGAEPQQHGTSFRVWAPERQRVEVVFAAGRVETLEREGNGYFSRFVENAGPGALYRFRLDRSDQLYPDPASRFQPEGPHGPSQIVDPRAYRWADEEWRGTDDAQQVIYEMHFGTFTAEGSYRSAIDELPRLKEVGITIIEALPVADFPGRFGWGYDGVNLWAPSRLYGSPDDLRSFVDAAHQEGLAVILDVVYNHLGPDGNYLKEFSPHYFTDRYRNDWGDAINFDGAHAAGCREFFIENAAYWIEEFHFDGLRLDATQQIFDDSDDHVVGVIARRVREAGGSRRTYIVSENEPQEVRYILPPEERGFGLNSLWNDDFHHSAIVALTGRHDAYYTDYFGKPQEFISSAKWGFLYQGQRYKWQKQRRGTVTIGLPAKRFVCFIENHDQVANSGNGKRLASVADPGSLRAMTALLLLGPWTPMLFQGQEFGSRAPFLYFADHNPELAEAVSRGRREFLEQFRSLATVEMRKELAEPHDPQTFLRCKLDPKERDGHTHTVALHRDLLALRRRDAAFAAQDSSLIAGAVLSDDAFLLRFLRGGEGDRLLIVNLGRDLHFEPAPEPLLAPPTGCRWGVLWSSESPDYGGSGTPDPDRESWLIPGRAAVVLHPLMNREDCKEE
jgi:maltooligosyltrehalose trehalohydrolase